MPTVGIIPANPFAKRPTAAASSTGGGGGGGGNYLDLFALPASPQQEPTDSGPAASKLNNGKDSGAATAEVNAQQPAPVPVATPTVGASQILPYLWLGGLDAAQDAAFLAAKHVKLILNLSQEPYWCPDATVTILSFDVADRADADILTPLKRAIPMLNKARDKWAAAATPLALIELGLDAGEPAPAATPSPPPPTVLVHCQKGVSRSVSIVTAFLMHQNGWSVTESLEFIQRKRPQAQPNMGFMEQLQTFYDLMTRKGESYNRTHVREQLCMLLRNIPDSVTSNHVRATLEPFGEVDKVERFDTGLCAIFFTTKHGRRWAEKAVLASPALRSALSQSADAPAQHVRMPSAKRAA